MAQEEAAHYQNGHLMWGMAPPAWLSQSRAVILSAQAEEREAAAQQNRMRAMSKAANTSSYGQGGL